MKRLMIPLAALGLIALLVAGCSTSPTLRVGTYDSRAIAIAFSNSQEGMDFVASLQAEMAKASEAKNDSLVRSIEKTAMTYQILSHLRAFSLGSVSDILGKHKAEVDVVAKEAGVSVMVSKFELMCTRAGVDTVDVTLPLVQIFKPQEQALKWISDIRKQEPMPMLDVLAIPPEE